MKLRLLLCSLVIGLAGCATTTSESRVATQLQAREFNSIGSVYMVRPTFASLADMSDGVQTLRIEMDRYGTQKNYLSFPFGAGPIAMAHIDKYLEWEALAMQRGDSITKEIGRSPAWANGGTGAIKFSMHSGNQKSHYMVASFCAVGTCLDDQAMYFDRASALELKRLLTQFDARQLKASDSSVYK